MTADQMLEAAKNALVGHARAAYLHTRDLDQRDADDASKATAYGQMLGAVEALALFLDATLPVDDEDADPTDLARAYAEGRDVEEAVAALSRPTTEVPR